MNTLDIVIIVVLAAVVALVVGRMIRNKRQGKGTCGCGCANCPTKCGRQGK